MRHASLEAARLAFARLAALEPELEPLWAQCRSAAPPLREELDDDPWLDDPPDAGWCAEDFFLQHVKGTLFHLVGLDRVAGPEELQTSTAYETVYDALLNWALNRTCSCCVRVEAA